jgi:hypothetical protein
MGISPALYVHTLFRDTRSRRSHVGGSDLKFRFSLIVVNTV